jgi:hypothetical protein
MRSYFNLSPDELDSSLERHLFHFNGLQIRGKENHYLWLHGQESYGFVSIPDTISIEHDGEYQGYTDVIQSYSLYVTTHDHYFSLLDHIKKIKSFTKLNSEFINGLITTTYASNKFQIIFMNGRVKADVDYAIKIVALGYSIVQVHFN